MKFIPFLILSILLFFTFCVWLKVRSANKKTTLPIGSQREQLVLTHSSILIHGKKHNVDCGTLVVPENRNNPASNLIVLPIKRIHSSNPSPLEPVFFLEGGPGQSNMNFKPPVWLLADHDVVMVGYRGVDGTPKLDCPEVSAVFREKTTDLLSPTSLDLVGAAIKKSSTRLTESGIDLQGYVIPQVVEDMESARKQLGYEKINLLSQSYGTRVAQIYANMYPDILFRSAMIGVNPPGHFLWSPDVVDSQVLDYSNLWKNQMGENAPDLAASMKTVNTNMPTHWLFLPINPGKVKIISFMFLYHRTTAPLVFEAYLSAAKGDPSGLALLSLAFDLMVPNIMTWGELFAIGCSADYEPGRDYRNTLTSPGAILGSPLSLLIWGSAAENWPSFLINERFRQINPSDVETLLINGNFDFATPARFAETELLPALSHAQSIVLKDMGHVNDFWSFQPKACQTLLTSFYKTGQADSSIYQTIPMDFKPKVRLTVIAKVLFGISLVLLFGLAALIWNVIQNRKRRQLSSNK